MNVAISEFNEMISQLKEKCKNTYSRSEELKILTVLPKSWGICRIEKEFQTPNWLATEKLNSWSDIKGYCHLPTLSQVRQG
jgi:enolase